MRFLAILICLSASFNAWAQQDLMLYNSTELWSKNGLNPAFFPQDRFLMVGLPALSLDAAHSGKASLDDAIISSNGQDVLDFSGLINNLDPENEVYADTRIETLSFGFKLPLGLRMSLSHAVRTHTSALYPKTLPQVLWEGNAQFIGESVSIGPDLNVNVMNELGIGLGRSFGNLTVGARAKILSGVANLQTQKNVATVFTDPDIYQLSLTTDYAFQSSAIISVIDTANLGFDVKTGDGAFALAGKNSGFAVDLGVVYQLNDRVELSASLLDAGGKITWDNEAATFHSQGTYTYDGAVIPGIDFISGSSDIAFDSKLDSLNDIFQFKKTASTFTTKMPMRGYLGGSFKLNDAWRFGATAYFEGNNWHKETALGLSAQWKPLRWLGLSAMYSANRENLANLGFGLSLTPGPVQLYALTDHVVNAFNPSGQSDVNFRIGMALAFGKPKVVEVVTDIL